MSPLDVHADDVGKGVRTACEGFRLGLNPKLDTSLVPTTPIEDLVREKFDRDLEPVLFDVLL
jgi:hypothetical protein